MPKLPDQFVTAPTETSAKTETAASAPAKTETPARSEKTLRSATAAGKTAKRAARKPAKAAAGAPTAKPRGKRAAKPAEKAPAAPAKARSASLLRDPAELKREVLVRLTEDEHRALEAARTELGGTVSLDDMIHRVLADWLARRGPERRTDVARIAERVASELRRFARDPLGTWRHLGRAVRRAALRAAS